MKNLTIGVIGNPNSGKTTFFNALTGTKQRVGNWPGVTVERKTGRYQYEHCTVNLVDTPGIYSLATASIDEEVARNYLLSGEADLFVNIVDASNIERNLYLTSQLLEMHIPMLIILNKMDDARKRHIKIDIERLSNVLGCTIIPATLKKGTNINELKNAINTAALKPQVPVSRDIYASVIKEAINELQPLLEANAGKHHLNAYWLAAKLLENDPQVMSLVDPGIIEKKWALQDAIERQLEEDSDILIASAHYSFVSRAAKECVIKGNQAGASISDRIDQITLSRYFGIPMFLFAMYLLFLFTINLGGAFIDFFDIFTGAIFVDGFSRLLGSLHAPEWLIAILANGVGGGIQTMATFIPPIGFMFLALSLLEGSGYMARATFVMDRFMRAIGLPGKSFIPMLVGFGCNVPAIMATRTLEDQRERTLTIMMNPFISCGARLPVYALFAAAFFPMTGQNLIFILYLVGIGVAVLTGLVLKHTLLQGEITPFVMELPPYQIPSVKSIAINSFDRLKSFLFNAGQVLIPIITLLALLNSMGTDGSFGNENSEKSVLTSISKVLTPALAPIGISEENWPATVGIFTGIFAKEAIVGTLDSLYGNMDTAAGNKEPDAEFDLRASLGEAFKSIPANLSGLGQSLRDPVGVSLGDINNKESAAAEQNVHVGTYSSMLALFGGKVAAFSYLLFVLLYFPCSATIAAVYSETNLRWTLFIGFWTTYMAYFVATIFYQAATFDIHPATSLIWISGHLCGFALVVLLLKFMNHKSQLAVPVTAGMKA